MRCLRVAKLISDLRGEWGDAVFDRAPEASMGEAAGAHPLSGYGTGYGSRRAGASPTESRRRARRPQDASPRERFFRARAAPRCYRHRIATRRTPAVTLHRLLPIRALAALACTQAAAAVSAQERQLREIGAAHAPLALSGDGAWRLHVDAHDVLHRVDLADPARESTVQLPPGVQRIAASGDGLKVALTTRRQVDLVDFGVAAGAAAKVSWRPWVVNGDGVAVGAPARARWISPTITFSLMLPVWLEPRFVFHRAAREQTARDGSAHNNKMWCSVVIPSSVGPPHAISSRWREGLPPSSRIDGSI